MPFFQSAINIDGLDSKDENRLMHIHIHLKSLLLFRSMSSSMSRVNLDRKQPDMLKWIVYIRQVSKLFLTFAKLKCQYVKGRGHIGSYDSLLCYL